MVEKNKKSGVGGRMVRSETVGVRLDPKMRYMAEIGARIQRRSLSSFIEWTIENSLKQITWPPQVDDDSDGESLQELTYKLWDIDEPDRIVKLGLLYPELLTYEEQVVWKIVKETYFFWIKQGCEQGELRGPELRRNWELVKRYSQGELTDSEYDELLA